MEKTYFIDSENVGDNWISLLPTLSPDDDILVFYTNNSPHMNYRNVILLKESDVEVTFIECCEGSNALDFQLCTELGFRIHDMTNREFIIVSNDTGFDAVVKYWKQRMKPISRITGKTCTVIGSSSEPVESSKKTADSFALVPVPEKPVPAPSEDCCSTSIDDNAKEILYLIGKNNLQGLHESLKQLYGNKRSQVIYNAFKKDTAYNNFLSRHKTLTLKEKRQTYCSIVFSMMAPSEIMPENFPEFLVESWCRKKNLNSLKSLLQQKYGKEKGDRYYSLFKIHIKILDKIT